MNAKSLAFGTLRATLNVLYRFLRLYVHFVVAYGPIGTAIALAFTLSGAGWGRHAAIIGGATILHFVLLCILDAGWIKINRALHRQQVA